MTEQNELSRDEASGTTPNSPSVTIRGGGEGDRTETLDSGGVFLRFLLFLACYYLAYRYPLQINSRLTSPTYSDTPLSLQLGKYAAFGVALALVMIVSGHRTPHRRFTIARALVFALYGYLFAYPVAQGIIAGDTTLSETGLFFGALIPFCIFAFRGNIVAVAARDVIRFLYIAIVVDIAQVALFIFLGRLPALAYSESLSVRFGSVWDDPNGFAVFLSFLLGMVLFWGGRVRIRALLGAAVICMLLATQSLTGIASTLLAPIVVLTLAIVTSGRSRWIPALAVLAITYAAVIAIAYQTMANADWATLVLASKSGSATMHLQGYATATRADIGNLLGVSPVREYGEAGYINLVLNHGALYAIAYVLVGLIAARRLLARAVNANAGPVRGLYWGTLFFLASYYTAMLNLPLEQVFPLNIVLAITIVLSEFDLPAPDMPHSHPSQSRSS